MIRVFLYEDAFVDTTVNHIQIHNLKLHHILSESRSFRIRQFSNQILDRIYEFQDSEKLDEFRVKNFGKLNVKFGQIGRTVRICQFSESHILNFTIFFTHDY